MTRRLRTAAVLIALTLALVACGGDGEGAEAGPASGSPTPSAKAPAPSPRSQDADAHLPRARKVNEGDAGAVAVEWARIAYSYDTAYDTHPHDGALRAARYLTSEQRAVERSFTPAAGPGAQWGTWSEHGAWTTPAVALADPDEHATDSATVAYRAVSVEGKARGRDGWKGKGPRLHAYLTLTRDGASAPWRISEINAVEAAS